MGCLVFASGQHSSMDKSFCRRERDHSEAERAQHIKQIHDLQEHIQEKERQLIELQEQVCGLYLIIYIFCFQMNFCKSLLV